MHPVSIRPAPLSAFGLVTYALAAAGGVLGYMPLLALLLPLKVNALVGADRYGLLAICGVAGAIVAGLANITFGWLGDRSVARGGGRRGWLRCGAIATLLSFAAFILADDAVTIVASIIFFQIAINVVLAQIAALIAHEVPAAQKGTTAALLTLGNPLAAGASALVVAVASSEAARLAIVAALMIACVAPLAFSAARLAPAVDTATHLRVASRRNLTIAWASRLLMQIANSGVGLYLLFYFEELPGDGAQVPARLSGLLLVAALVPVPLAMLLGRWSDRIRRQTPFLAATSALAMAGLLGMALAGDWVSGSISYVAVATGAAVFVALNTGYAMLLLPSGARCGRELGILNLANTLPQVVAPLLAWRSTETHGFGVGLMILAVLALTAGLLPLLLNEDQQR